MKLYALSLVAMLSLIACGQQGSDDSKNPDTSPTDLIVTTPKISGEPDRIVSASSFYEYIPVISDTGEQVEITGTNIPGWLTLDASSGALSGTPGERDVGVYNGIVIKVSNEAAETSFGPFSITVLPEAAKIPLTIEGIPQIELDEGQNYFFKPVVSHEQSTLLTFKIVNKPAALTFNSLNGELSGAFGFDTAGTYPGIVISVEDGTETKSLPAFSITVNNVNRAPTISGTPVSSIMVDEKYRFFPSASDEDGDTLSFSSENFPNWLSVNEITGEVHGTPAVNEIGTYTSLKLIVSDSRDSAVLTFNVTVTETPNNAPTISGTPANSIIEGANYSFVPTFGDADNDTLSFSSENFPAWLNVNALTGEVHGTPAAMNVGSYTNLKLIVSDGRDSAALTFSVNVTAKPNNTPTISGTPPTTVIAGQYYEFIPGANDVDSDPLSFTITNKPLWASFDSITGALSGTPTVNHIGTDAQISITVTDGRLSSVLGPFSINVQPSTNPDDKLVIYNISNPAYQLGVLGLGELPYVDRSYAISALPTHYAGQTLIRTRNDDKFSTLSSFLTFEINVGAYVRVAIDKRVSNTPSWLADWSLTGYAIEVGAVVYTVYEKYFPAGQVVLGGNFGITTSSMYMVFASKTSNGVVPLAKSDIFNTLDNQEITLDVLANDLNLDNLPVTVSIESGSTHALLSVMDNKIVYTPNGTFNGEDSFTYRVSDKDGDYSIATATVNVSCGTCLQNVMLTLSWNPNPSEELVQAYRIYFGLDGQLESTPRFQLSGTSANFNLAAPSIEIDAGASLGLKTNDFACFAISAINLSGESALSDPICSTM